MLATTPSHIPSPAATVLVVDDMPDARDVLARLLRLDGYKSLTADDGESALAAVRAESPDLILLDLTMPGMDGLEVLRRLREEQTKPVPVIFFTAVRDRNSIENAQRLGADDYIVKGAVSFDELLARIAMHLPAN